MSFTSRAHFFKAFILGATTALFSLMANASFAQGCDRTCLGNLITQYVDALAAKDHTRLPLADTVKYTVDGQAAELGDGVWQTVTGVHGFRHDYLDVKEQIAASHVAFHEDENLMLLSLVLHVDEQQKISGIETLVTRVTSSSRLRPTELGGPIRGMNDPIPAGQRMSRDNLVRIALTYAEGLRIGNFSDAGTPFAPETYRVENGAIMAQGEEMYGQNIIVHPGIIASVVAVDEENGTVLLWLNFGHTGSQYGEGNALVTYEAFKIWGNQIHSINAFFTGLPISRARFWPSIEPVYRR